MVMQCSKMIVDAMTHAVGWVSDGSSDIRKTPRTNALAKRLELGKRGLIIIVATVGTGKERRVSWRMPESIARSIINQVRILQEPAIVVSV